MKLNNDVLWVNIKITIYVACDNDELNQEFRFILCNDKKSIYRCDLFSYIYNKIMDFVIKNEGKLCGYKILSKYTIVDDVGGDDVGIKHKFLCSYHTFDFEKLFDLFYQKLITITE